MKSRIAAAACALMLTTHLPLAAQADGIAFAQAGMRHCGGDISRLCANVFPGGGRIAQCLIDQYGRLSPDCRSFVAKTKSAKGVLFACEADAARVCADVPPGKGRVVFCLNNNRAKLSPSCNRALDTAEAALTR